MLKITKENSYYFLDEKTYQLIYPILYFKTNRYYGEARKFTGIHLLDWFGMAIFLMRGENENS